MGKSNTVERKLNVNMNEDSEQVKKGLNTDKYLIHNIVGILAIHSMITYFCWFTCVSLSF